MNIQDILNAWLRGHGYDGLVDTCGDCACVVGDNLCRCEAPMTHECVAAHKVPCACAFGCDWHMAPGKREGE